jgi:hypothetical protein
MAKQGRHPNSLKNLKPQEYVFTQEEAKKGAAKSAEMRRKKASITAFWQEHFINPISEGRLSIKNEKGKLVKLRPSDFITLCFAESPIRTVKEAREATEGSKSQINVAGTVRFG